MSVSPVHSRPSPEPTRQRPWLVGVRTAVLAALLAIVVARTTLNEPPFRRAPLAEAGAYADRPVDRQMHSAPELMRAASAVAIVALAAVWALTTALGPRRFTLHHAPFGIGLLVLAACLLASAYYAADRREACTTAAEQISLLLAAFLVMQLARRRWQRRLVLVTLVGAATMLGAKGLFQVLVEIPDQIADYRRHEAQRLAEAGHRVGTPGQRMFQARVTERTTKGWFGLANIYGSLMVLATLAAAGLAVDKWLAWRAQRSGSPAGPRGPPAQAAATAKGNLSPLAMAAALSTLAAAVAAIGLVLTHSKGAIACGLLAGTAAVAIYLGRSWASRHRSALLTAGAVALVVGTAGVIVLGTVRGRLPSRSLQVRWEYWTASAAIVADRPGLGTGPGNFADAYLVHRLPGAEESVKNPHNVLVQALTEYGLPGGLVYLALLAWMLAGLCRPAAQDEPTHDVHPSSGGALAILGAIAVGALAWRIAATHYPNGLVLLYDNFVLLAPLAPGLAAAWWLGRPTGRTAGHTERFVPVALACGLGGFALHNLTDFALFYPGAALAFWAVAGSVLAGKNGRAWRLGRAPAIAIAAVLLAALVVVTTGVLAPVRQKTLAVRQAAQSYSLGDPAGAISALRLAVTADTHDAAPSADLASLLIQRARLQADSAFQQTLADAVDQIETAIRRNPTHPAYHETRLLLRVWRRDPSLLRGAWSPPPPDLPRRREKLAGALARHGENPALLNLAAQYAWQADDLDAAIRHLRRALDRADGQWPILWDRLGDALWRKGETEQAVACWRRFWRSRPGRFGRNVDLIEAGVEELARMDGQNSRLRLRLAELAWHIGRPQQLERELDAALAADAALWPASVLRFNDSEKATIRRLREKARETGFPG